MSEPISIFRLPEKLETRRVDGFLGEAMPIPIEDVTIAGFIDICFRQHPQQGPVWPRPLLMISGEPEIEFGTVLGFFSHMYNGTSLTLSSRIVDETTDGLLSVEFDESGRGYTLRGERERSFVELAVRLGFGDSEPNYPDAFLFDQGPVPYDQYAFEVAVNATRAMRDIVPDIT